MDHQVGEVDSPSNPAASHAEYVSEPGAEPPGWDLVEHHQEEDKAISPCDSMCHEPQELAALVARKKQKRLPEKYI